MMNLALLPLWLWTFLGVAMLALAGVTGSLIWAASGPAGQADGRRWSWGLALGVPLVVVGVYAGLGHPRALDPAQREPGSADAQTMVRRLADRLARNPDQPEAWAMLARSYKVLGRHADAAQAYEQAAAVALQDPDLLADWIETRVLAQDGRFDTRAGALLAQAEAAWPQHEGVLLLTGLAALDRGDAPQARRVFERLREAWPDGHPDRAALDQALARMAQGLDPRQPAPQSAPTPP